MLNESALNSTLQQYISGTTDKSSLLTYFAQHYFLIPILMIILIPFFVVIVARTTCGKMSREAFWTTYIISVIISVILAILTFTGILPLNLNV